MTLFKKLSLLVAALTIGLSLAVPVYVSAQSNQPDTTANQGFVPCGSFANDPCQLVDLFNLVITITNFLIGFAGVVAVLVVVLSGYFMVVAAGNIEKVTAAKKLLVGAVIGFFFVMASTVLAHFLVYGSGSIIPGTELPFIRGEPTSIIKCPVAYILGRETCGDLTGTGSGTDSNENANNAPANNGPVNNAPDGNDDTD
jgi:hypothetical protein